MHSDTPEIIPFISPVKRRLFSEAQLGFLKSSVLRILAESGIHFPSKKALSIFADHGAQVDIKNEMVKIPPELVEKAVSTAPRSFVLAGREERFDLRLGGKESYHIPSSCGVHFIDPKTRVKRKSTKSDLAEITRVFDALPLMNIVRPIIAATDCGLTSGIHECQVLLTHSLKHVRGGTSMHPELAPYLVEMARTVSGSAEAFRKRPVVNANICTLAPLAHDSHSVECALIYAEAGMPVSMMAMPVMGTTAPASPMAALIVGEAEVVSGIVLLQLAYPGTPVIHSNLVGLMDPLSANCILDVSVPVGTAAVQMAQQIWEVPSLGGVMGCMNAKSIGWESGMVDGQASILMNLDGADIPGFTCLLDDAMTVFPEHIILVNEILQRAQEFLHPIEFSEEDLAIDLIKHIGPHGHFLMESHTVDNFRRIRHTKILRQPADDGKEKDPKDVALEQYKQIAEAHHPKALPEEIVAELEKIVAAADRKAGQIGNAP